MRLLSWGNFFWLQMDWLIAIFGVSYWSTCWDLSLVEHDVHLMKIWKVSGTKSQAFSLSLSPLPMHIWCSCAVELSSLLLCYSAKFMETRILCSFFLKKGILYSYLSYLIISSLPTNFSSVRFKPTVVSHR